MDSIQSPKPPLSFSKFTLESACRAFGLSINQEVDLFPSVPSVPLRPLLRNVLSEFVPLAKSIHTEKARSEFIVAPILAEVRHLMNHRVSLFSGIEFIVSEGEGLNGFCDFVLSTSPVQLYLSAPAVMIVEAKNDNIKSGFGQCVAEMVAARRFNERAQLGPSTIHGAVTTGSLWQFLRLDGETVFIDLTEYYLDQVEKLLGILVSCVGGDAGRTGAAA